MAGTCDASFRQERWHLTRLAGLSALMTIFWVVIALNPGSFSLPFDVPDSVMTVLGVGGSVVSLLMVNRLVRQLRERSPSVVLNEVGVVDYTRSMLRLRTQPQFMSWHDLVEARPVKRGTGEILQLRSRDGRVLEITLGFVSYEDRYDLRQAIGSRIANRSGL